MKVPRKENMRTLPMFLKKGFLSMLYPLSKMIGGKSININKLTKCYVTFFMVDSILIVLRT